MVGLPTIYVVTVKSFHDRVAHMRAQEQKFGLTFEYLWPYDAGELTDEDCAPFGLPTKASISSARKHLLAEYRLIESGDEFAIVLEDDAILDHDFVDRIQDLLPAFDRLAGGWVVNLAGADSKLDQRFLCAAPNDLIERPIATVEGYVINRLGAERRVADFERLGMADAFDHWLQKVDERLGIPHFWVGRAMLKQGSVTGAFTTVLDSSRGNKPLWFLGLKFRWNVLRRKTLPQLVWMIKNRLAGGSR